MKPIILGPCRCQGCSLLVYWDGWRWRNFNRTNFGGRYHGSTHLCQP